MDLVRSLSHLGEVRRLPGRRGSFLARDDRLLGAPVVARSFDRDPTELLRRFARARSLLHPSLAPWIELRPAGESAVALRAWVEGEPLDGLERARSPAELVELARQLLQAIELLHERGTVHGRIAPANLIRSPADLAGRRRWVLTDGGLGLPYALDGDPIDPALGYVAPEVLEGGPASVAADLYSAGVLLFRWTHARPPLRASGTLEQYLDALRSGRRSRPVVPREVAPPALAEWLATMTSTEPERRPTSARDAWEELAELLELGDTELDDATTRRAKLLNGVPAGREAEAGRVLASLLEPDGDRRFAIEGRNGEERRRLARSIVVESGRPFEVERDGRGTRWSDGGAEILETPQLTHGTELVRIPLGPLERSGVHAMARKIALREVGARIEPWLDRTAGMPAALEAELIGSPTGVLDHLTPAASVALERLACYGLTLAPARRAALDEPSIGAGLFELLRYGLLEPPEAGTLRLRSRETLHATLSELAARGEGAEWIEPALSRLAASSDADEGAWLVELYDLIDRPTDAAACAKRVAAAVCERRPDIAERLYRRALAGTARRAPERALLRASHADALRRQGELLQAARGYQAAARSSTRADERAESFSRAASLWARCGRFAAAIRSADRALELCAAIDAPSSEARSLRARGIAIARSGHPSRALDDLRRAVELLRSSGDELGLAITLTSLALCELDGGRSADAIAHHEASIALFERLGRSTDALANWIGLTTIETRRGHYARAVKRLEEARARCDPQGDHRLRAVLQASLAKANLELGRLALAREYAMAAEHDARHCGDERLRIAARTFDAETLLCAGRPEAALARLDTLAARSPDRGRSRYAIDPPVRALGRLVRADAALAAGLDDAAIGEELDAALAWSRESRDPDCLPLALLIEARRQLDLGEPEACAERLAEVAALFDQDERFDQPAFRIRFATLSCRRALELGRPAEAEQAARRALTLAEQVGSLHRVAEAAALLVAASTDPPAAGERQSEGRQKLDEATSAIADEELERSFVDRPEFRALLRTASPAPSSADRRLGALYQMIRELNTDSSAEPAAMLGAILDKALDVVRAERGLVLLRDGSTHRVVAARNLGQAEVDDVGAFSTSVVESAGAGRAIIAIDTRRDERFRDAQSVTRYGIRSVLCVPLKDRGETIGAVYLDNRRSDALFDEDDLRFLEAFADHAALALRNARRHEELRRINQELKQAAADRVHFGNIIAVSDAMLEVCEQIDKVASDTAPVLISGESGTGKELVARAIHFNGPRRDGPFLSENTAAIPTSLLGSELFGHQRGAFTGADRDRRGLFELAHGGTLFLDEVGDMSLEMQVGLLRAIQQGEIRRLGGDRVIKVDVRIVAATHRNLDQLVRDGRFREDLLYRLRVLTVTLPPLRDRPDDIPALIEHVLERIGRHRGRTLEISAELIALIKRAPWPGNVRQLESSLQRMSLYAIDGRIGLETVQWDPTLARLVERPGTTRARAAGRPEQEPAPAGLGLDERQMIRDALVATGGNKAEAARQLGIGRQTLYRKIRKLGL